MMSLMSVVASAMPVEKHIELLEEKIADYKSAVLPSEKEEAMKKLIAPVTMFSLKLMNGDKKPNEILDETMKVEQASETVQKMINPDVSDMN